MKFNDIRMKPRLIILFLLAGLIPLGTASAFIFLNVNKALLEKSMNQLETTQDLRLHRIKENINRQIQDLKTLSRTTDMDELFEKLFEYHDSQNIQYYERFPIHTEEYKAISNSADTFFKQYLEAYGYGDLFLICKEHGHVMYSTRQNSDLGVNLSSGALSETGLARVWNEVKKTGQTTFIDYHYYQPSEEQSAFLGQPVYNAQGLFKGVLVLRLDSGFIEKIMDSRKGMGETGESYLISWVDEYQNFEFRSNMKTMGDGDYIVGATLDISIDYWEDAKNSKTGSGTGVYTDSIGKAILVNFSRISYDGLDWILISKINRSEVLSPLIGLFIQMGLGALFLIAALLTFSVLTANSITKPIQRAVNFADTIAHEKFDNLLDFLQKDEMGDLARSLNEMARDLKKKNWIKDGKEGLDDALRGEHTLQELADIFISYLVRHMGAELGAVYLIEEDELVLTASYAFSDRKGNFNRFKQGEGMIGQTALEKNTIYFTDMGDHNAPNFNFGVGESTPPFFLSAPLLIDDEVIGAFLIGTYSPFTARHRSFIEQNAGNIAVLFNSAKSRTTIRTLLEEAQHQREELRVTNEELEQQTQALKASEEELQAQQEELRVTNEELQERTDALQKQSSEIMIQNTDLEKARKEIEKKARDLEVASKYKSEFLANMSHELRTPLNSILILSQLISKNKTENLNEKQIASAEAIHSSGSDLLKLINEILDLSKVEAGKLELHIEEMKIDGLINDMERVFRDMAHSKNIEFLIESGKEIPETLHTDSHRLQQILRNLLTNAFKFAPGGKVILKIGSADEKKLKECQLTASNAIAFSVIDNGIGIPEEKQSAIFEAFQQADGSTSRKYGGTGLGLSISRELTKLLGGQIFLTSKAGEGSDFTIVVPRVITTNSEKCQEETKKKSRSNSINDQSQSVEMATETKETPLSTENIRDDRNSIQPNDKTLLIIEDDPAFVGVLKDLAAEQGYKVLLAGDGETGLHFADYYRPSAIILDIGLPGIDGWTVMERLKSNPELRHIPVHFMSGSDNSLPALKMGAVGYLTKPVSLEKIQTAFEKIEHILTSPVQKLLIVEDDEIQRNSIKELIGNGDVKTFMAGTGEEACNMLKEDHFDCMILDLGLQDMSGFELLERIRNNPDCSSLPVIVYTGRDLTQEEESKLKLYTEKIIIKGVKSPERLLDETALFLHRVENNLPGDKKEMLNRVHPAEQVLSGKKILLVDDDMRNVFALSNVLEEKELEVSVARDGVECLEKLENGLSPDLILMDIMMPRKDGYETMREIRKEPSFRKLPIIALTAKAMKGDRNKCIEAGANDYLAKPVDTEKLLSMMRVWLY